VAWLDDLLGAGRVVVLGVVNTTPDSFSDGGLYVDEDRAVAHGLRLIEDGADIVDVGGESTRPGACSVPLDTELARVLPVVRRLAAAGVRVSIDTRRAAVAEQAIEHGAVMVNDIAGLRQP
jgi:dihydropteroate synthase